jgi:hypothetical protein
MAHDGGDRARLHDDGILVPASLRIAFADVHVLDSFFLFIF